MSGDVPVIRGGTVVAVVGPSGAGKDTVIAYARRALAGDERVHFVRRVVTRPSDASLEDHASLDEAAFETARAEGAFAVNWSAHGLHYALPAELDEHVRRGRIAIANLSRGAIPALRQRYGSVLVVQITASRETLARRLAARGRETESEVLARLARDPGHEGGLGDATVIDNSNAPEDAGEAFLAIVRSRLASATR
jgi:ribose 1,5-bisphosphokinase